MLAPEQPETVPGARRLEEATPTDSGGVVIEGQSITRFRELVPAVVREFHPDLPDVVEPGPR